MGIAFKKKLIKKLHLKNQAFETEFKKKII